MTLRFVVANIEPLVLAAPLETAAEALPVPLAVRADFRHLPINPSDRAVEHARETRLHGGLARGDRQDKNDAAVQAAASLQVSKLLPVNLR